VFEFLSQINKHKTIWDMDFDWPELLEWVPNGIAVLVIVLASWVGCSDFPAR